MDIIENMYNGVCLFVFLIVSEYAQTTIRLFPGLLIAKREPEMRVK